MPGAAQSTRTFSRAPSLLPLYLRASASVLPGGRHLPGVPGGGSEIPPTELRLPDAEIDRQRLAAYREVTCFSETQLVPPTYPHILAFPLHMALMANPRFPFPAVGLVHVANEIVQRRPLLAAEHLAISVRARGPEPHPRGRTFTILTTACAREELVWEERSTMLSRGRSTSGARASREEEEAGPAAGAPLAREAWTVGRDVARRYAAASGDRNPIHTSLLGARAFGFPGPIAHGMWSKARCLAALAPELPEAFAVSVRFRKPLPLGGKVSFECVRAGEQLRFSLRSEDRETTHLEGRIDPGGPR
jgi:acyl dehydratase